MSSIKLNATYYSYSFVCNSSSAISDLLGDLDVFASFEITAIKEKVYKKRYLISIVGDPKTFLDVANELYE